MFVNVKNGAETNHDINQKIITVGIVRNTVKRSEDTFNGLQIATYLS
jgi:hypothetical protein